MIVRIFFGIGLFLVIFACLSASVEQRRLELRHLVESYPELCWLADEDVSFTHEGIASDTMTDSEVLFGKKYIEFDRTLMALRCLEWFLTGTGEAYEQLVKGQKGKLAWEHYCEVHRRAEHVLNEIENAKEIMCVGLLLRDMGKAKKVREKIFPEIDIPDNDDFYGEAIEILDQYPNRSQSFECLNLKDRACLVRVANLAHYGHITHLEGCEEMFTVLRESRIASEYPVDLELEFLMHTSDVAGALGHVSHEYSIVYTDQVHLALEATYEACRVLGDGEKKEIDAYRHYVKTRACWLGFDESEHVLTRIGAMLRLYTPEEGHMIKRAYGKLSGVEKERVQEQFDGAPPGPTPTYMPAMLVNFINQGVVGETHEEKLELAVTVGVPFIARVLEYYGLSVDSGIRLNFNSIAGVVKEDPLCLVDADFVIDDEGFVTLG